MLHSAEEGLKVTLREENRGTYQFQQTSSDVDHVSWRSGWLFLAPLFGKMNVFSLKRNYVPLSPPAGDQ
jgi:hypothetical protein